MLLYRNCAILPTAIDSKIAKKLTCVTCSQFTNSCLCQHGGSGSIDLNNHLVIFDSCDNFSSEKNSFNYGSISLPSSTFSSSLKEPQYFFLVRHGIYLTTCSEDDGLIELGRQQSFYCADLINSLAKTIETKNGDQNQRLSFTYVEHSGYKRSYETGLITGRRLNELQRLTESFENCYSRVACWSEVRSISRIKRRWYKIKRLFFSSTNSDKPPKHHIVFSHGNLISGIVTYLMSGGRWDRLRFGNLAPHCSVTILSYTNGDLLPIIVLAPFQVSTIIPITINNVNPRKMCLQELPINDDINDQVWSTIINTIIPKRVVGLNMIHVDLISKFIPGTEEEEEKMKVIIKQFHTQIVTQTNNRSSGKRALASNFEEEKGEEDRSESGYT
ncbi:unnamed protein product, partial [Didymodactylos carnosus]